MAPELTFALALSQSGSLALSRALSQLLQFHSERLKRDQVWLYMYTNPHDWLYTNPHDCMGLMQPLIKIEPPKYPMPYHGTALTELTRAKARARENTETTQA